MRRRQVSWFLVTAVLAVLVAFTAPAFPMAQEKTDSNELPGASGDGSSKQTVEQILEQQERLLRGHRFTYDPGNRRDPFQSLFDKPREGGPRPPGIQGMSIDEIDLTGIVEHERGNVAYFTGSDNKGYFLRVGEGVYKATMISIDPGNGSVTFRQKVDDPRQIKPYRDVVRTLVPAEENR
jgi:hypothetical protein